MQETTINENKKEHKVFGFILNSTNGMAIGLFATLIVGTIIWQLGLFINSDNAIVSVGKLLQSLMGIGIGVGIAWALKLEGIKLLGAGIAGAIAGAMPGSIDSYYLAGWTNLKGNGQPLVVYISVIASILLLKVLFRKKTPVDFLLVPLFMAAVGFLSSYVISFPTTWLMERVGDFITYATTLQPVIMGMIIAVVMGIALTSPISSAAIAISINLSGLAGGAAVVGCCSQMVGFAIMSRKDNNIGMVLSIGIGTSMLQFKNILRKPLIWVPTILTSLILGPLATTVFQIQCNKVGAGMGTAGLVGPINTITSMAEVSSYGDWKIWVFMILLEFVLPFVLTFAFDLIFRRLKWIKTGDLKV